MNTRAILPILCGLPLLAGALETVVTAGAVTNLIATADSVTVDPATGRMTLTGNVGIRKEVNTPKGPQIQIDARIIEIQPEGKEDILSTPRVVTLDGQEAAITVGQEVAVPTAGELPRDFPARVLTVEVGVKLAITASIAGKDLLLQGRLSLTEVKDQAPPRAGKAFVVSREVVFSHVTPGGAPVILDGLDGNRLRIELLARVLPADNAAPVYWQAFAALPERPDTREGPEFESWLKESERALQLLHAAAAKDGCDWNLDLSKGPELELSHLSKARALASASLARASRRAAADADGAIADLSDALRLSRHLGLDPVLICQLVRVALEKQSLELIDRMRPALTAAQAARLAEVLASLRPAPTLEQCIRMEGATFLPWLRARLGTGDVKAIQALGAGDAAFAGMKPDELRSMLDHLEADYAQLACLAALPPDEYAATYEPWAKELTANRNNRPLSAVILPAIGAAGRKLSAGDAELTRVLKSLRQLSKGPQAD